jgi:hypothetical protein
MENYFQWRPRSNKPMRSPAELHPDWQEAICPLTSAVSGSINHVG